jgi:predicted nuclease of predicted toxin-antitoxin system
MASPIRYHLDEHVPPAIAHGLRRRGIDVTTANDAGLAGASDPDHIAFARSEGRVIFTSDEDYLVLHEQGIDHAGIVSCRQGSRTLGEAIRFLVLLHACMTADEMDRSLEYA